MCQMLNQCIISHLDLLRQLLLLVHVSDDEHLLSSEQVLEANDPYEADDRLESKKSELVVLATETCRIRYGEDPRALEDLRECDNDPEIPWVEDDLLDCESVVVVDKEP